MADRLAIAKIDKQIMLSPARPERTIHPAGNLIFKTRLLFFKKVQNDQLKFLRLPCFI